MKKIFMVLFVFIFICGFASSQESDDYDEYRRSRDSGGDLFLIFTTFVIVIGLVFWLRHATRNMKTQKKQEEQ